MLERRDGPILPVGGAEISAEMYLPALGDRLPKKGNCAIRALGTLILRLSGRRIEGTIPNREKLLIIAAPLTTP